MCGILYTSDNGVSPESFYAALSLLQHRGPDFTGYARFGEAHLGHTRLKVIDLDSRSNQPFLSADGRYALLFNGEIYNYRDLARRFNLTLRTSSDTEVLLEMYLRFGHESLQYLEGMFAFIVVDSRDNSIFVARDRLGVKPLYITTGSTYITLASEIAPLLALHGPFDFDPFSVRQYRKLRACFNNRTLYQRIHLFPAGHYFDGRHISRYWRLPEDEQPPPDDGELEELIVDSIRHRVVADVSVGSYLSGGLDSSLVAALTRQVHTWTVGLPTSNEFAEAEAASIHIGSEHHQVTMDPNEFVPLAQQMIRKRREPLSVPNEVLLYAMTAEVKQFNTVVMSGEGADELFFGYDRIFRWANSQSTFDIMQFANLYSYGSQDDIEVVRDAVEPFMHLRKPIAIVSHFFQVAHLHGLLRRLDNSTMLCAVEARVPFVDCHRLVERMAGVTFEARMEDGVVKSQLKRVAKRYLPSAIVERKKVGFPVPLDELGFTKTSDLTPMDKWLEFNLCELGAL